MINDLIDKHFPIKNSDGSPRYRPYQKETIIKIIEAFQNGKKFVCLNGPVGCGKSAINYTVGMCLGKTVYLTHQKQLQDQMVKELWPEIKMVKGRGAYCCNGATILDERIRCNYSGDQYETCQNSNKKSSFSDSDLLKSIHKIINMYGNDNRIFRMRSGFEISDDISNVLNRIKTLYPNDVIHHRFYSSIIGCDISPVECPVKSTRVLSQVYQIRILNPDVFYMLNRIQSPLFNENKLMVIDECHKIENIVERIFGGGIHVEFLKKYFGIDISELYDCQDIKEFTEKFMYLMKTVILPAKCAAILTSHLWPIYGYSYLGGGVKIPASTNQLVNEFKIISDMSPDKIQFNMLNFIDSVCKGNCENPRLNKAWVKCREYFLKKCEDNQCDHTFFNFSSMKNYMWYNNAIEHLEDIVGLMNIPNSFIFSNCMNNMWRAYEESDIIAFVKNVMPDYHKAELQSIKLVPINVPEIMNTFFYNKAEHVILSTGTWIDQIGMMKTFGVNMNSVEMISIPTTFDRERRPIYILRGSNYMDFSQKNESGSYIYKTHDGTLNFTRQLGEIIEKVREYCKKEENIKKIIGKNAQPSSNANVIVHVFSFDLAKRIAEFCPYVNEKWFIQIGKNDKSIKNKITHHVTNFIHKDEILQYLFRHPNEGITFVSASVNEGVDFKYDTARIQIILKKPIPSLGDPYVMSKYKGNETFNISKDPNYLDRAVFTDMIQMYGRIMRAEDDWGITITFDQSIAKSMTYMLSKNGMKRVKELGIDYFVSAIRGGIGKDGFPIFDWPFG